MSNVDSESASIALPLSDDVSKEVVSVLRKLSGEINDLSNNLYNAKVSNEEGSVSGSSFLDHPANLNKYLK